MKRFATATATVLVMLTTPAIASAKSTQSFLSDAVKGDNSESMLGALAQKRGQSAGVRAYGRMLERDHGQAKVDAVSVARRERVAIPAGVMPEADAEYRKLQKLSGMAFDREFARYMVEDHQKDISEFEDQVKTGNRTTAMLAGRTLPHLRQHLKVARSLGG